MPPTAALLTNLQPTLVLSPPSATRAAGVVYTPIGMARYILARLSRGGEARELGRTLDPACGDGVFLDVAIEELANRMRGRGIDPTSRAGAQAFIGEVRRTIHGIDIDENACHAARSRMLATVARITGKRVRDGFDANVRCRDFLLSDAGGEEFDSIVGNPPYVTTSLLTQEQKEDYRRRFFGGHGRIDLYVLFFEAAVRQLTVGGRLAFITPDKFLLSQSARRLREFLASEGAITGVARFRSHRLFAGVATVPCVTTFERRGTQGPVEFAECANEPGALAVIERTREQVPAADLRPEGWRLVPRSLREVEDRIRAGHRTLASVSRRISAGLATGRDGVYVLPEARARELGIEAALLRPAVGGRDIHGGRVSGSGNVVLVPYEFDSDGTPRLIELARYPKARAHLESHRDELSARHCIRVWEKRWYDIHDPVPMDLASVHKVLVPDIAEHNRFAADPGRVVPLHSAYYIIPITLHPTILAALLNSLPLEFLLRLTLPLVKDGFSRYRAQFVSAVPIPEMSRAQQAAFARAAAEGDSAQVDTLALRLFGLSQADASRMRRFLLDLGASH